MNWHSILTNHFIWGLAAGLVIWALSTVKFYLSHMRVCRTKNATISSLINEKHKLKQHLQIQLEIESESKERQKKTLEKVKEENENLRTSVQTLRLKPKREEIILLQVYDRAIHIMHERAPGFAPTWENTLKEAKTEIEQANKGIIPFIRKVIHPSSTPLIMEAKHIDDSE